MISLSHTDLDGYGAQYVLNELFDYDIIYYNVNYDEIQEKIKYIVNKYKNTKNLLVITDLNLTYELAEYLDSNITDTFKVLLVDHHKTPVAIELNKMYNWYNLNAEVCGAQGILDYFTLDEYNNRDKNIDKLVGIIDLINTYDMWIQTDIDKFNKSSYLSNLVYETPFEISELKTKYIFYIIKNIGELLLTHSTEPIELNHFPKILKRFLNVKDVNLPMSIKAVLMHIPYMDNYIYDIVNNNIIYTGLSTKITQYCFNYIFKNDIKIKYKDKIYNPNEFTLINYNTKNGNISIRSTNNTAQLTAIKLGGNGHPNASGAFVSEGIEKVIELLEK